MTTPNDARAATTRLCLLSDDQGLRRIVRQIAAELGLDVLLHADGSPCVIDPALGATRLGQALEPLQKRPYAAILWLPARAAAVLEALRRTRAVLINEPRLDAADLRAFLARSFDPSDSLQERREYPRAPMSGVRVLEPPGVELLDLSPFGLRVRTRQGALAPVQQLRLAMPRGGHEAMVHCQVFEEPGQGAFRDCRMRFARIPEPVQHEFLKIGKASLICQTISETFARCEQELVPGYRATPYLPERRALLHRLVEDGSQLLFARMRKGRAIVANVTQLDDSRRQLRIRVKEPQALGPVGNLLRYACSVRFESLLLDGYLLGVEDEEVVLSWPTAIFQTDRRAQDRWSIGLTTDLYAELGGTRFPVVDLSPRGFSFFAGDEAACEDLRGRARVEFLHGRRPMRRDQVLLRHRQRTDGGVLVGALFLPRRPAGAELHEHPEPEGTIAAEEVRLQRVSSLPPPEGVEFGREGRPLVGLWSEVPGRTQRTVVIVPPPWARTKETSSLLAQCLCATMQAHGRQLAVLRFDYGDALGESHKDPLFRHSGREMLGLTFTACVEDIREAIRYACDRLGPGPIQVVLVGMSFSGPLCLRAAVQDSRVTALVQLMGASDIQDLVRTSTGGIDYVARHRAGIRCGYQNVLGVLADPDRWTADGLRAALVYLQDAQYDAARLDVPLLWIHGQHDSFVNVDRIRSILEAATCPRRLVTVPTGHLPARGERAHIALLPLLRSLLPDLPAAQVRVVLPEKELLEARMKEEWRRAPKTSLPPPDQYWRDYMLGTTEKALGFDVLALTREYRQLMRDQVSLLRLREEESLHDLGGGLGHVMGYLEGLPAASGISLVVYDFVPELLDRVKRKAAASSLGQVRIRCWNAEEPGSLEPLSQARVLLMSLFLSCLEDPLAFLRRLHARLAPGSRLVASTILEDADLSGIYTGLLAAIETAEVPLPRGYSRESFVQAVRDYMNSAAWLLKLSEEGVFKLFGPDEFASIFRRAGFVVREARPSFGTPPRALVLSVQR